MKSKSEIRGVCPQVEVYNLKRKYKLSALITILKLIKKKKHLK